MKTLKKSELSLACAKFSYQQQVSMNFELDQRLLAHAGKAESPLDRWLMRFIRDERDLPVVRQWGLMTLVLVPLALATFSYTDVPWWLGLTMFVSAQILTPPYILALHVSSHRPVFRTEYRWMQTFAVWILGPLAGQSPETYRAHHMGMHHPENNMWDDLSCTLRYQRDRASHFAHYFYRFTAFVLVDLCKYMAQRQRWKLLRQILVGELGFYIVMAGLLVVRFEATMIVLVGRLLLTRFMMMAGNWVQHAFIDPTDPADPYRNSVVCIDTSYNRSCFNDGFHVGHHVKAHRHWSEMPQDFLDSLDEYAEKDAVVFRGVDYGMVWLLLMLGRHESLVRRQVVWPGDERSFEERVDALKARLRPVSEPELEGDLQPAAA